MDRLSEVRARLSEAIDDNHDQLDSLWRIITSLSARRDLPTEPASWLSPFEEAAVSSVINALNWRRTMAERGVSGGHDSLEIHDLCTIGGGTTALQLLHPSFAHTGDCLRGRFSVLTDSPVEAVSEDLIEGGLCPMFEHFMSTFERSIAEPFRIKMLESLVVTTLHALTYVVAGRTSEATQLISLMQLWAQGWIPLGTHYGDWYILTDGEGRKQEFRLPD